MRWVLHALDHAEALLRQLPRRLQLRPHEIKHPQSPQHREELHGFANLPAQVPGPGVGLFHFWGRPAFGRCQRSAQGGVQRELLVGTLGGVRQLLK
jgi:hypothetical protein